MTAKSEFFDTNINTYLHNQEILINGLRVVAWLPWGCRIQDQVVPSYYNLNISVTNILEATHSDKWEKRIHVMLCAKRMPYYSFSISKRQIISVSDHKKIVVFLRYLSVP